MKNLPTLGFLLSLALMSARAAEPIDAPHVSAADTVAAGRYLVRIGMCDDCHTAGYAQAAGNIPEANRLTGNPIGYRGPWGTTYAANLRLTAQNLDEDAFVTLLKTRKSMPPMPWQNVNHLSDKDARAIYTYLHSLGPKGKPTPSAVPPDQEPVTPYEDMRPQHMERLQPRTACGGPHADKSRLKSSAQAIVDTFVAATAKAYGSDLGPAPTVEIRNTPPLIYIDYRSNKIVVPIWYTESAAVRSVFRTFAGGDDEQAERLFRCYFNRFLIAHEASHWFQYHAHREEASDYENENMANRMAVAFWRTQPGSESFLDELERLAVVAAASVPDPTPPGVDPVAYLGANYEAISSQPLKYGYYQWKFTVKALQDRKQLDFARMVAKRP